MAIRLRRSHGEERQQVRLIALAVAALVVGLANTLVVQGLNGGRADLGGVPSRSWSPTCCSRCVLAGGTALPPLRHRGGDQPDGRARGRLRVRRRRLHDRGRAWSGGSSTRRTSGPLAVAARDGAGRAGLPAAAASGDQGGQPDRLRLAGRSPTRRSRASAAGWPTPRRRPICCPPSRRRPAAPWPRGVRLPRCTRPTALTSRRPPGVPRGPTTPPTAHVVPFATVGSRSAASRSTCSEAARCARPTSGC